MRDLPSLDLNRGPLTPESTPPGASFMRKAASADGSPSSTAETEGSLALASATAFLEALFPDEAKLAADASEPVVISAVNGSDQTWAGALVREGTEEVPGCPTLLIGVPVGSGVEIRRLVEILVYPLLHPFPRDRPADLCSPSLSSISPPIHSDATLSFSVSTRPRRT